MMTSLQVDEPNPMNNNTCDAILTSEELNDESYTDLSWDDNHVQLGSCYPLGRRKYGKKKYVSKQTSLLIIKSLTERLGSVMSSFSIEETSDRFLNSSLDLDENDPDCSNDDETRTNFCYSNEIDKQLLKIIELLKEGERESPLLNDLEFTLRSNEEFEDMGPPKSQCLTKEKKELREDKDREKREYEFTETESCHSQTTHYLTFSAEDDCEWESFLSSSYDNPPVPSHSCQNFTTFDPFEPFIHPKETDASMEKGTLKNIDFDEYTLGEDNTNDCYEENSAKNEIPSLRIISSNLSSLSVDSSFATESNSSKIYLQPPRSSSRHRKPTNPTNLPSMKSAVQQTFNHHIQLEVHEKSFDVDLDEEIASQAIKEKKIKSKFFRRKTALIKNDSLKIESERTRMSTWKSELKLNITKEATINLDEESSETNICTRPPFFIENSSETKPEETKIEPGPVVSTQHMSVTEKRDQDFEFLLSEINDDIDLIFNENHPSYHLDSHKSLELSHHQTTIIHATTLKMAREKIKSSLRFIWNACEVSYSQESTLLNGDNGLDLSTPTKAESDEFPLTVRRNLIECFIKDHNEASLSEIDNCLDRTTDKVWENPKEMNVDNDGFLTESNILLNCKEKQNVIETPKKYSASRHLNKSSSFVWFKDNQEDDVHVDTKQKDDNVGAMFDEDNVNSFVTPSKFKNQENSLSNLPKRLDLSSEKSQWPNSSDSWCDYISPLKNKYNTNVPPRSRSSTRRKGPLAKIDTIEEAIIRRLLILRNVAARKMSEKHEDAALMQSSPTKSKLSSFGWKDIEAKIDFVEMEAMRQIERLRENIVDTTMLFGRKNE